MSTRKTVPAPFRDVIANEYPGLGNNLSYWRLMQVLLFTNFFDEKTDKPIVSQGQLARCENKLHELESGNYVGATLLNAFKRDVMPKFKWSEWSAVSGHSRVATPHWTEATKLALDKLRRGVWREAPVVMFDSGKPFNRTQKEKIIEEQKQEAVMCLAKAEPRVQFLLEYLNGLPTNKFSLLVENMSAAEKVVEGIKNETIQARQQNVLRAIEECVKPLYRPSRKGQTVRIFTIGASLAFLKKDVRHALTKGWTEADMISSQLAICAKLWSVDAVTKFLESGVSVWQYLEANTAAKKDAIKEALYSLMFGQVASKIEARLDLKVGKGEGKRFLQKELIKQLYEARQMEMNKILSAGFGDTCFGKRIFVDFDSNKKTAASIRSILAQQAQAVEMDLLLPVVKLAVESNQYDVLLWQHDGFSVVFRDKQRKELWKSRISKAVEDKAAEYGIVVSLEWKEL